MTQSVADLFGLAHLLTIQNQMERSMPERKQMPEQPVSSLFKINITQRVAAANAVFSDVYARDVTAQRYSVLSPELGTDEDHAVDAPRFGHFQVFGLDLFVTVRIAEKHGVPLAAGDGLNAARDLLIKTGFNGRDQKRNDVGLAEVQPPCKPVGRIVLFAHHSKHAFTRLREHLLGMIEYARDRCDRNAGHFRYFSNIHVSSPPPIPLDF